MNLTLNLMTLLVVLASLPTRFAQAQVPDLRAPGIDYEYLELAPEPLVDLSSPTREQLSLDFEVKNQVYSFSPENIPAEYVDVYLALTPEQQHAFLENRSWLLKKTAQTMVTIKYTSGVAQWFKDKIQFVKRIFKKSTPLPEAKSDFSQKYTQEILQILDQHLWRKADLIADPNDKFVLVAPGIAIESGRETRGTGGAYDLGFGIGWNRETKTFIFEFFQHKEQFQETFITPAIGVGVANLKVGVRIANVTEDRPLVNRGTTFYPPGIPGFLTETRNSVMFGFSSGLGSPGSDFMGFKNTHKRRVIVRIGLSPKTLGFLRIHTEASWTETLNWLRDDLEQTKERFRKLFGGRHCGRAYVN